MMDFNSFKNPFSSSGKENNEFHAELLRKQFEHESMIQKLILFFLSSICYILKRDYSDEDIKNIFNFWKQLNQNAAHEIENNISGVFEDGGFDIPKDVLAPLKDNLPEFLREDEEFTTQVEVFLRMMLRR